MGSLTASNLHYPHSAVLGMNNGCWLPSSLLSWINSQNYQIEGFKNNVGKHLWGLSLKLSKFPSMGRGRGGGDVEGIL